MSKRYNTYTIEFKKDAVELANEIGLNKASKELGVASSSLSGWVKNLSTSDYGNTSKNKPTYNELLKEVKKLRKEAVYKDKINDVLKKSLGIISSDQI